MDHAGRARAGIVLGAIAVALWSGSSALIVFGGGRAGVWQFTAVACGIGGLGQMLSYLFMGRSVRSLLAPPRRVWLLVLIGFVIYMLAYNNALVLASTPQQKVGVSLTNYLWPTVTVLLAVLVVPGTRMTWRLGAALALSLAGLALANWQVIGDLVAGGTDASGARLSAVPYLLGLVAAVAWGLYSALVARWRNWAQDHASAALGFLVVSALAAIVCTARGEWRPISPAAWCALVVAGLGPQGVGYMVWELALHRAPASVLGLMGAAIPVLSTAILLGMFALAPDLAQSGPAPDWVTLILSAAMIGGAVLIVAYRPNKK
jgi:drug/metabolite transporter (DMT)-like permease